ncbi:hypothetical protein TWF192_004593 [Orbilia oligospora]|nr:hypothetical protein TWF192_004593 [Orbilia oligospora]
MGSVRRLRSSHLDLNKIIETDSGKFVREKLGWGLDRDRLVEKTSNVVFGLITARGAASSSWNTFNLDIMVERIWEIGQFMSAMQMPANDIPSPGPKADLDTPSYIFEGLISFRNDIWEATENTNKWKKFASQFGFKFDHPFFARHMTEKPSKYDLDIGYRDTRNVFTLLDLFDYLLAWYGCWYRPWADLVSLVQELTPLPGDEHPIWKDTNKGTDKDLIAEDLTFKIEAARRVLADRDRA